MTKERRLAIQMWEQIVEALEQGKQGKHDKRYAGPIVSVIKAGFCEEYNLKWEGQCWFCQYMRHDQRDMPSRRNIPKGYNGCQRCPLYIEHKDILEYDECGCAGTKETLWTQVWADGNVHAAKRILELLKGGGRMAVIKIHDSKWFMEHCKILSEGHNFIELVPIYPCWDLHTADCVSWLSGDSGMGPMEGKVLKVEHDIGINQGDMTGARYFINGFWIPNWAIEWVKEIK